MYLNLVQFSSVAQLCLTLCDPMHCSPPGSSVQVVFQARIVSGLPFPNRDYVLDTMLLHIICFKDYNLCIYYYLHFMDKVAGVNFLALD